MLKIEINVFKGSIREKKNGDMCESTESEGRRELTQHGDCSA
jgi:hypothetical protein